MWVTIMCDASYCQHTGASGWGSYVISDRGRIIGGGCFHKRPDTSTQAETRAIVNAVWLAFFQGVAEAGDELLIQADCIPSMRDLEAALAVDVDICTLTEEQKLFRCLTYENNVKVLFRHVRAHTGRKDRRSVTNHMCDRRARDYMEKDREAIKRERRRTRHQQDT